MKLLNVTPRYQWEDEAKHNIYTGARTFEDSAQKRDPFVLLMGEIERKHMTRMLVREWRRGSEVRFVLDDTKNPIFNNRRM